MPAAPMVAVHRRVDPEAVVLVMDGVAALVAASPMLSWRDVSSAAQPDRYELDETTAVKAFLRRCNPGVR